MSAHTTSLNSAFGPVSLVSVVIWGHHPSSACLAARDLYAMDLPLWQGIVGLVAGLAVVADGLLLHLCGFHVWLGVLGGRDFLEPGMTLRIGHYVSVGFVQEVSDPPPSDPGGGEVW